MSVAAAMSLALTFFFIHQFFFPSHASIKTPSVENHYRQIAHRLYKPLIGRDGRVYVCSGRNFLAFESNGTLAHSLVLNYTCSSDILPAQGDRTQIYLVAENRVHKVNFLNHPTSASSIEIIFGPLSDQEEKSHIIGLSVTRALASVFINIKNNGLFTLATNGNLLWSVRPALHRFGYRQGCKDDSMECYFTSDPVVDLCEATVYISNNQGEVYSIPVTTHDFRWVRDMSSFGRVFVITPGNNGRLYITVISTSLIIALDASTGNILWQASTGPLNSEDCRPVVDSNGWISVGSMDGYLHSVSPFGDVRRSSHTSKKQDSVIQISPLLDCSGFAVYFAQTEIDGKIEHKTVEEGTYFSALKPKSVTFTMIIPATTSIYWSEIYPSSELSSLFPSTNLEGFMLDEKMLLAFVAISRNGKHLPCRTSRQKLESTCSTSINKSLPVYHTGNEKRLLFLLLFESITLVMLTALVGFCCVFWRKKKLQKQNLGEFLSKRRSLQLRKKAFDQIIAGLEKEAADAAAAGNVVEELGDMLYCREGIERKLSSTYSLGRDNSERPKSDFSVLPKSRYSFRGVMKENLTIFQSNSDDDASSSPVSSWGSWGCCGGDEDDEREKKLKKKGKCPIISAEINVS